MRTLWARDRATAFYSGYGVVGLLVIAIGFGLTYALQWLGAILPPHGSSTFMVWRH